MPFENLAPEHRVGVYAGLAVAGVLVLAMGLCVVDRYTKWLDFPLRRRRAAAEADVELITRASRQRRRALRGIAWVPTHPR